MNVDINNQFHQHYRLRLTHSIFSFLYYLLIKNSIYNIQCCHTLFFYVLIFIW
jgi:hypothetical protein